jgi:hypothetical protein
MFNHAPMYCNSSYQCANGCSYNQHTNSYENLNIGIILKDIYEEFNHNTYVFS